MTHFGAIIFWIDISVIVSTLGISVEAGILFLFYPTKIQNFLQLDSE